MSVVLVVLAIPVGLLAFGVYLVLKVNPNDQIANTRVHPHV
jgi:hypothetical protein